MGLISQLPALQAGALETWLMCALVVSNMLIAVKALTRREQEFVTRAEFQTMDKELGRLRAQIEGQHLSVVEKLARIEGALERLDERTSGPHGGDRS